MMPTFSYGLSEVRPVDGFPDYYITNDGAVYSKKFNKTRKLKPSIVAYGYYGVILCQNGKTYSKRVHRLVAEAFIPKVKKKSQVNHKNGNKLDNSIENLEWCTPKENIHHAFNELSRRGGNCKLSDTQAIAVKSSHAQGIKIKDLAKQYGLCRKIIKRIVKGVSYNHIKRLAA